MPYKIVGKKVVKKDSGKTVGHSKNPKKYLKVLNAVEHGWKPGVRTGKSETCAECGKKRAKFKR